MTLAVNVASECGFTPQYAGLQALQDELARRGFVMLGFPSNEFGGQEPGTRPRDQGVLRAQVRRQVSDVREGRDEVGGGPIADVRHVSEGGDAPNWNFCKYLVGKNGKVLGFYSSKVAPDDAQLRKAIDDALSG